MRDQRAKVGQCLRKLAASSTSTELNMRKSLLLCGLCGLIAGVPDAAAVGAPLLSNHLRGRTQPIVSQAASHCWWRAGRRHCSDRINGYHSRWYPRDARQLRTGSQRWWDQKDSEGSTGRP